MLVLNAVNGVALAADLAAEEEIRVEAHVNVLEAAEGSVDVGHLGGLS